MNSQDRDDIVALSVKMDVLRDDVEQLEAQVRMLTTSLNKYQGAAGGILLAGSLVTAALTLLFNYLKAKS